MIEHTGCDYCESSIVYAAFTVHQTRIAACALCASDMAHGISAPLLLDRQQERASARVKPVGAAAYRMPSAGL